jgi:hypothetical protein
MSEFDEDRCTCLNPGTRTCPRSGCEERMCDAAVCARRHLRRWHAADVADEIGDGLRDQRKDEDR